jgi:hypothetical protein
MMKLAILLLSLPAFAQEFRPILVQPEGTSGSHTIVLSPVPMRPGLIVGDLPTHELIIRSLDGERFAWSLGTAAYPFPCSDHRVKTAKPGQYAHIYCTDKHGTLLMDGKPVAKGK